MSELLFHQTDATFSWCQVRLLHVIIWSAVLGSGVEVEGFEHAVGTDSEGEQYYDENHEDPDGVFDDLDNTDNHGTEGSKKQQPSERSEKSHRTSDNEKWGANISPVISGQFWSVVIDDFIVGSNVDKKADSEDDGVEELVEMPKWWKASWPPHEQSNYIIHKVSAYEDTENDVVVMVFLLVDLIKRVRDAQADVDQEDELKDMMDNYSEDCSMHLLSKPGKERSLLRIILFLRTKEHDIILAEENVKEDDKWIQEEDGKSKEKVENLQMKVYVPPVTAFGSAYFTPEKILIEGVAHKVFVIVPKCNLPGLQGVVVRRVWSKLKKGSDLVKVFAIIQHVSRELFADLEMEKVLSKP